MAKQKLTKEIIPRTIHPIFRQHFCYSLSKSGVLFRAILEDSIKEFKITPPQGGILHILVTKQSYNQNLLGQEMSIDKASMVKFIDGLEKLGYIERTVDPDDRRAKLLTITPSGRAVQKKIAKLHRELEEDVLKSFNEKEKKQLRELMPRMLETILQHLNGSC